MKLRRTTVTIAAMLTIGIGLFGSPLVQTVSAQTSADQVCAGIAAASGTGCNGSNTSLDNLIANAVNILSILIGVVAVIMIMVGGFKYITASGDSSKLGSAKNTIIYAIIGLVIVALAQGIVHFVLHTATTAPPPPKKK